MNFFLKKRLFKMNYLTNILSIFALGYLATLTFTYIFQRSLLYHPNENNYSGDKLFASTKIVKIKTKENIELLGWFHEKDIKKYKTILFFHGNTGSLENRIHKLNHYKNMNINFLIISWRGFSQNKGKPTENGLYEDAASSIRWLKSKEITEEDIIIYGESLGTAVAVDIAQNKNFAGIILESPFTSMIDVGKEKYPFLPVSFLLKDKYESDKKIKNIKSPILIMHGRVDKIVPFYMGEKMYELANKPKYYYFTDYDDHMMEYNGKLVKSLSNFIYSLN